MSLETRDALLRAAEDILQRAVDMTNRGDLPQGSVSVRSGSTTSTLTIDRYGMGDVWVASNNIAYDEYWISSGMEC